MATETQEAEVKTEKVFDLTEGKFVDKPVEEKKETGTGRSKEGPDNIAERKGKEEEEKTPKEEEKNPKEEEKNPKEEEKTEAPDFQKYLKEKFDLDSEDAISKLIESNKALEQQLKKAQETPKEYEFKSAKEKAIAEFLKDWDMSNVGEGIEMAGRLMEMDPKNMNEKAVLQEQFVLENSDISRGKAIKLFNDEYKKEYVLNRDNFESEDEFKEAQEIADIRKEKRVAAAKKLLLEKKETLKFKEKEAKKEEKQPEKVEIPKETVQKYVSEVNNFFSPAQGGDFDRFTYEDEENPDIKVTVQFTKEEVQNMKKEATAYLHSVSPYDESKKIPNFDSGKLVAQIADILYGDQIKERMLKEVVKLAKTLRIEQLAETKPDKKSGGGGKGKEGIPSVDQQFVELAKKAAADRAKKK